ncbi:head-tail joining protein [Paracoccus aminophilus]|nr:hypothetical protein [Paracoccus aminophilus]
MTGIFDGMAGILADVVGTSITYHPASGAARDIQSVFREAPIEVEGADGHEVLITAPTWRVSRAIVPDVRRGDRIAVSGGRIFRVMAVHPTASPAMDAFVVCELQVVEG